VGRPLKKKLDPKIIQQKKYVEKMYKMVSTFKLSHYPVLPDSTAIRWSSFRCFPVETHGKPMGNPWETHGKSIAGTLMRIGAKALRNRLVDAQKAVAGSWGIPFWGIQSSFKPLTLLDPDMI
jgi:hypothetical protein